MKRFRLRKLAAFCTAWSFITRPSMEARLNMAEIAILERNALSRR